MRTKDTTALHLACHYEASADVICFVASKFPAAAREKNYWGCTPLYFACKNGKPVKAVSFLMKFWPDAVDAKDRYNISLIHWAFYMCR
mmetsp:Transcript_16619/g.22779  ORF Transcript_16619/g.22779 Transcript_16619/m.22779 type:complete len:88 (+) Transcript_16619:298-561(+)